MKLDVNVDWEVIETIVRDNLIQSYKDEAKFGYNNPKDLKAFRRVIKFYSTPDEWKQFKKELGL